MIPGRKLSSRLLGGRLARILPLQESGGLLVLAYHRVTEADPESFPFDYGVVSASPEEFRRQMQFVSENFDVLGFSDLDYIHGNGKVWPKRGLVITFDDGYHDNYAHAFPILKEFALPATIFLTTGFIGKRNLFWWDLIAYCFKHTPLASVRLREISAGVFGVAGLSERLIAIEEVLAWVKRVPDDVKNGFVAALPERLAVDADPERVPRMHLDWDEVRDMSRQNIEFGSHTVSHPVLANVNPSQLRTEVQESKVEIERQTGRRVLTFSYPVGNKGKFNRGVRNAVEQAGYRYAVSYIEGVAGKAGYDPLGIPRIHVDADHPPGLFTANLTFPRLMLREQSPYSF